MIQLPKNKYLEYVLAINQKSQVATFIQKLIIFSFKSHNIMAGYNGIGMA